MRAHDNWGCEAMAKQDSPWSRAGVWLGTAGLILALTAVISAQFPDVASENGEAPAGVAYWVHLVALGSALVPPLVGFVATQLAERRGEDPKARRGALAVCVVAFVVSLVVLGLASCAG
jgi:uncharacterized membrane protein